jgi:2',3'-cyclic-nucleotide 2'-phosphodiesterase (5'-nucleotidase family)
MSLPPALDGTELRILATSDLGATTTPLRTTYGESGTCAGVVELLERELERQATIWLDVGDFVIGSPAYPLLGERPWTEVADLPIAAATIGNHEFDDGVDALLEALPRLAFPVVCANLDIGLAPSTCWRHRAARSESSA